MRIEYSYLILPNDVVVGKSTGLFTIILLALVIWTIINIRKWYLAYGKKRYYAISTGITVFFAALALFGVIACNSMDERNYKLHTWYDAAKMLEEDHFDYHAYYLYQEIYDEDSNFMAEGGYSAITDGMNRTRKGMLYQTGIYEFEAEHWIEAIEAFVQIQDFRDSHEMMQLAMENYLLENPVPEG